MSDIDIFDTKNLDDLPEELKGNYLSFINMVRGLFNKKQRLTNFEIKIALFRLYKINNKNLSSTLLNLTKRGEIRKISHGFYEKI